MDSNQTWVGLGSDEANPTVLIPVNNDWTAHTTFAQILDDTVRQLPSKDFASYQGVGRSEFSLKGPVYTDVTGYLFLWMLGAVTSSGSGPYTHTFLGQADEHRFNLFGYDPVPSYFTGGALSSLELTVNPAEGLLTYSVDGVAKLRQDWATPTQPAMPEDLAFVGHQVCLKLDNANLGRLVSGSLRMAREVTPEYYDCSGQTPGALPVGPLEVTGAMTIVFNGADDLALYETKQTHQVELTWTSGANTLHITVPQMDFGDGGYTVDHSKRNITIAYDAIRALHDATLGSNIQVELTNNTQAYA